MTNNIQCGITPYDDDDYTPLLDRWMMTLSTEQMIVLLYDALDLMSQFNNRSYTYCICRAAGFEQLPNEGGWVLPKIMEALDDK